MHTPTLTKSERAVLQAIWDAPDKVLGFDSARRAAKLTPRGGRTVIHRMEDYGLVGRSELPDTFREFTITFRGMRALGVTG